MQIGFQPPYAWNELNEKVTQSLGLSAQQGAALVTPGIGAALGELTAGFSRLIPHKKKVFYFKSLSPQLEEAALQMSREGFQVQSLDLALLDNQAELNTLIDGNTLAVLSGEDDPLLGRCFDLKTLESVTEAKRTFLVKLSHSRYRFAGWPAQYTRNTYSVISIDRELALILLSNKIKWSAQYVHRLPVLPDALNRCEAIKNKAQSSADLIRKFEGADASGAKPVWDEKTARYFDRAVIFWPDLDGWAVAMRVSEKLKIKLPPAGHPSPLETTSLNRWRGVRTMDWLYGLGLSAEMIRGTLIIDQSLIARPDFISTLSGVCAEIRKIQSS